MYQDVIDELIEAIRHEFTQASEKVKWKIAGDDGCFPEHQGDYTLGKYDRLQQALDIFRDKGYSIPEHVEAKEEAA